MQSRKMYEDCRIVNSLRLTPRSVRLNQVSATSLRGKKSSQDKLNCNVIRTNSVLALYMYRDSYSTKRFRDPSYDRYHDFIGAYVEAESKNLMFEPLLLYDLEAIPHVQLQKVSREISSG